MFDLKEIRSLIIKDLRQDLRSRNLITGTVLYIFSTLFVCYLSFRTIEPNAWNALFWIIALFAVTNASNKIFLSENSGQRFYLYTLANPRSVISAKMTYQCIFSTAMVLLVWISWKTLFGIEVRHPIHMLISIIPGMWALSNILTLNHALAAGNTNSPTVLTILSFPLMLPILMTTIRTTRLTIMSQISGEFWYLFLAILALNALTLSLSFILFPYLWRY